MSDVDPMPALRKFIEGHLLHGRVHDPIEGDTPLVSSGLLDSLATIELLAFLEERLGVRLEVHEVDWSTMDTLDALVRVVAGRREPQE